jgi:hypothetical protein
MLTQLADDGSDSDCASAQSKDNDRCTTYTVFIQTGSGAADCSLSVTDTDKVSLTHLTGTFVSGSTFNGVPKYSCSFSPQNELYLGDAEVTLVFKNASGTTNTIALTFKVKRGNDPSDGELLEIFTGHEDLGNSIGEKFATSSGNEFLFNYHLRDKRYKAKDQSGRLEATGSLSVNLEAKGIAAKTDLKNALSAYGHPSRYSSVATAIRIEFSETEVYQTCRNAIFEEADSTVCPDEGVYNDYVVYKLYGTFGFIIALPAFHNDYIVCNSVLCAPTLEIKVESLSSVVRDALIGPLTNTEHSFLIDTISPKLVNMKGTINTGNKLEVYYSLDASPSQFISTDAEPALYKTVDLRDASGTLPTSVSDTCNIASKQVYEVLRDSRGHGSMDSMFLSAKSALAGTSCTVTTTVALGGNVDLWWGVPETLIKDDDVTLQINSRYMSHDSLNVLRGSDVELTGAETILKALLGNSGSTVYDIIGVRDINGADTGQQLTTTQDATDLTTYSTGCDGYFDIHFKRNGAPALQYSLRVPCTRGTVI